MDTHCILHLNLVWVFLILLNILGFIRDSDKHIDGYIQENFIKSCLFLFSANGSLQLTSAGHVVQTPRSDCHIHRLIVIACVLLFIQLDVLEHMAHSFSDSLF